MGDALLRRGPRAVGPELHEHGRDRHVVAHVGEDVARGDVPDGEGGDVLGVIPRITEQHTEVDLRSRGDTGTRELQVHLRCTIGDDHRSPLSTRREGWNPIPAVKIDGRDRWGGRGKRAGGARATPYA